MKPLTAASLCLFVIWLIGIIAIQRSDLDRATINLYMFLPVLVILGLGVVVFSLAWVEQQIKRLRSR